MFTAREREMVVSALDILYARHKRAVANARDPREHAEIMAMMVELHELREKVRAMEVA